MIAEGFPCLYPFRVVTALVLRLQFALVLLTFLGGGALSMAADEPLLVITGASYAADWKSPQLPGYTVVNKGKGGDETKQVLARFDADVLALKPAAVLIWGHINNYHRAPGGDLEAAKSRPGPTTRK